MASYNKVILVGNLTRDPEVKYTTGGTAIAELGLAVSRQWFDQKSNERREETTFVDVTLWGRQAEVAGEYLAKGRPVLIEGRLQLDTWDDKETGKKRSKLRVVGEQMQMLGSREGGAGGGGSNSGGYSSGGSAPRQSGGGRSPGGPQGNRGGGSNQGNSSRDDAVDSFYDSGPPSVSEDDVPF